MSIEPQQAQPIVQVQARQTDPLEDLGSDEVLRCEDPETGRLWFYDECDGGVARYHERDGYAPRPTARTVVAETVALSSVESCSVSRVHLDVRTGEIDE